MSAAPPIEVHDLTVAYHHRPVLWDVDVSFRESCLTAIIGPNGAGKSTLIKAIMDLAPLASGEVRIYGETARKGRSLVAYVPQRGSVDWDFPTTVEDVVMMGRYGRLPLFGRPKARDREIVRDSLEKVGMLDYRGRQISQLSGGQQQRVFLARALAQQSRIYLMDEPFAGVDASTERAIVRLLQELRVQGNTVIAVHHDLQTAPEYFDDVLLLNMRVVAHGPVQKVFTQENLQKTYGGQLHILTEVGESLRRREWSGRDVG